MLRSFVLLSLVLTAATAHAQDAAGPPAAVPGRQSPSAPAAPPTMPSESPTFALAVDAAALGAPSPGSTARGEVVVIRQDDSRRNRFRWKIEPVGRNGVDAADFGGKLPQGTIELRRGQTSGSIAFEVNGVAERPYPREFRVTVTGPITPRGDGETTSVEMFLYDEDEPYRARNGNAVFGAKPS